MSLIAALNDLQTEHGHLSESTLRELSAQRSVPLHAIQALVSFYPHFRTQPPPSAHVAVCRDMACHLAGGGDALCGKLRALALTDNVEVDTVSCLGRCEKAPAVAINDMPLEPCDPDRIMQMARDPQCIPAVLTDASGPDWPYDAYDNVSERYSVLQRLRAGELLNVTGALQDSGLRGMGGAAFPTGRKWDLVARQSDPTKYVICNADESEPGTFKDRAILAERPHLVLEAMAIAANVIGARTGYVFIRHEYEPERQRLAAELDNARSRGVLTDAFDIEIFTSPGGYILGEETALLECMEDKRGEPRNKPPYPGEVGLHGKPTLINNVETFAAVPAILNRGPSWWKSIGVNGCTGFKFISVSGHVNQPGVYQIPMGTTVRDLIDLAGGVLNGAELKAFAPGGASSNFLPADYADTPIDFDHLAQAGSMLGSGALFVVAEGTDLLALATNVSRFFRNESCGKCVPCRVGSEKAVAMLERILAQGGDHTQLQLLNELAETMLQTSICGLGQVAIAPVLSVIDRFPQDVALHVH